MNLLKDRLKGLPKLKMGASGEVEYPELPLEERNYSSKFSWTQTLSWNESMPAIVSKSIFPAVKKDKTQEINLPKI